MWHAKCNNLHTANEEISWTDSVLYLGVFVTSASKFTCNYDRCKANFYASFNAIFSKLGRIGHPIVTLNLVSSIALPCLLFATEALPLTKTTMKVVEHPWSRISMKTFSTLDLETIRQCQYFTDFLPVEHLISARKVDFIKSLESSPHPVLQSLFKNSFNTELKAIASEYNVDMITLIKNSKRVMREYFSL